MNNNNKKKKKTYIIILSYYYFYVKSFSTMNKISIYFYKLLIKKIKFVKLNK